MIALAILIATFLAGTFTGLLALLRLATAREQRGPFSVQAQTPVTAASRRVTGLYVRRPEAAVPPGYVTARVGSGQERRPAPIPRTAQPIGSRTALPEISSRAMDASEMQARSYDWRDE